MLSSLIGGKINILMISENKLDATSHRSIFHSRIFYCVQIGWKWLRWGDNVICQRYYHFSFWPIFFPSGLWGILHRVGPSKEKMVYLLYLSPHNKFIKDHLKELRKTIEFYSKNYENIIMGDFSAEISELNLVSFCTIYNFKRLINKPICHKNPDNPSCIDLILTNCPNYFQNSLRK